MKFLIAGLGSIGRRHFRNLLTLGERDIVLYRTHQSTLPDEELAGFPVETDLRAALAYGPDAVIICNPTAMHLDVAIPAARCGCHLLIEKPISHSLAHMDELQQVVVENDVKVLVGYQFRFHPGLQRIKKLLNDEAIGEPLSVRAHWGEYLPGWHPWEDYKLAYAARPELGGGVVLTLSHPLDYLHWFFGDVESLRAFNSQKGLHLPVEDEAEILMQFISGVLGSVHLDYNQRPASHWLEILGSRGNLRWDNSDGIAHMMQVGPDGSMGAWQESPIPKGFERNTMFLDELRHFREVIKGKAEPACSLHDGLIALQLALAALKKYIIRLS
ncbi:MAG TPA: Gfo/Idh/MocA family oxidoreductase [Anaerolineales bacterium]|nr:Gfo/Idh/MocA family oxidoreductase [Anaerolineales bacterium]